jgi:hypothetical protein
MRLPDLKVAALQKEELQQKRVPRRSSVRVMPSSLQMALL